MVEKNTITKEKLSNLKKTILEFICPKGTDVEVLKLENQESVLAKEGLILSVNNTRDILAFNLINYIDTPENITKDMIDGCLENLKKIEGRFLDKYDHVVDAETVPYALDIGNIYYGSRYKIVSTIDGKPAQFETEDRVALLKALDIFDME